MLTFRVLSEGASPAELDLSQMYLTSLEGQPIRARFRYVPGMGLLFCERRSQGLAALNLPWPVRGGGRLMLRTALLPDRDEPYLLPLELARGQFAAIWRKKEDWGYSYGGPTDKVEGEFQEVKLLFARVQSIQDAPMGAADMAEEMLGRAVALAEQMVLSDARVGIAARRQRGTLNNVDFGCHWEVVDDHPKAQERFGETFNYATIPFLWRTLEPREHELDWKWHDDWIQWLEAKGMVLKGGSLIRFDEAHLPDWVWIWENDFEAVRDYVFDHVERCVQRYRGRLDHWEAVSGLHVENCMNFSLDRILEVSRLCAYAVKRTDPRAAVVLGLVQPWGEYFATNQRSIWPYNYAEMCINAGVPFDAIGLEFLFGTLGQGFHCRDLLAVSDVLDLFGSLGKPVHITAAGVPSACYGDPQAALGGANHQPGSGGVWRRPWDEALQAEWLDAFYRVVIAKPFVRAVSWRDFSDHQPHYLPHGGLLRKDLHPKAAFQKLLAVRHEIWPDLAKSE